MSLVSHIPEALALDDTAAVILSYLPDPIIEKLYISGLIPRLSSVLSSQQFWHARVETFSELRTPYATDVDWRETYYLIVGSQDPYNEQDNAVATDILCRMGSQPGPITLGKAARYGQAKIVSYLLTIGHSVNPVTFTRFYRDGIEKCGDALSHAVRGGHTDVFSLLLADPRIDPANGGESNYILTDACLYRRHDMLQLLIKDGRATTQQFKQAIVELAISGDDAETVQMLLSLVRPCDSSLSTAIHYGRERIVAALLDDGRIDPHYDNGDVLFSAVERGRIGVVRALLADPRVDPTVENNRALELALNLDSDENAEIATLLLMNDRVRELFCSHS